jgi:hypothetical protein
MATEGYVKEQKVYDRLNNNFTYHKPFGNQSDRYELIRAKAKELAEVLVTMCPESRELSIALTELETSIFWANASIARNETEQEIK